MTVNQMREYILKVYPGPSWKRKVAAMYDDQVIAVYYKFLESGKFDEKDKNKENSKPIYKCMLEQMSLFDIH